MITHPLVGDMDECAVLEGGIDLVRGQSVLRSQDDLSVPAEYGPRGIGSPVKLSTGRPRTASQSRRRPSQPLLARSLPAGWKVGMQAAVCRALEPCPENAGRGIPEVDLEILARLLPEWRRPGSRRPTHGLRSAIDPDETARLHFENQACWLVLVDSTRDGDLEAVRAKRQVFTSPRPDRSRRERPAPGRRSGPRHRDERGRSAGCPD